MGLTKPRAHQLQDIDYKQTARAVTTSNITLSGGAPATVDGVSLALRDRVLVTGQSTGSENGIYYVTTVGAGSNGTWARSLDADTTGEVSAGMIIMVTEGTTYADTQWKLTTDDPITIGSTSLTFVRNGNAAYGTVAVSGEDSIVADAIGDTLTIVAGTNLALTTNASTDTLTITPSLTPSLTSVTATGNITGGNLLTGNVTVDDSGITATGNIQADMLINREQRFTTSNMMKFNQLYTGAASGSYFTNGEYQKVVTITPSGASQNYQVVGRITAQNAAETHTVYFNAALRSNTLPDLDWSILYTEEYNGSRYLDPQLWTKETTTAGFIFAFKTLATIYGTVTVDIDVIPRTSALLTNVVVNTVQNSEQGSVDAGFTANDMTLVQRLQNTNMTVPGNITAAGLSYPTSDGTADQVLVTDGSGTLSFADASGGGATVSSDTSTNTNFLLYFASTTTGALTAVKQDSGLTYNPSTGLLTSAAFSGSGASLTALNGSNISTGTVAAARVATLNQNTTGTAGGLSSAVTVSLTGAVTGSATFTNAGDTASISTTATSDPTITLTGDVTGSGTMTNLGDVSFATTIAANSVALSTDTTGNYVQQGATSGSGISGSVNSEGGTFTVTSNATDANTASTIVFRDGSGNFSAGVITATATQARYADLAEKYTSDQDYEPGTVVELGGEYEVTQTRRSRSTAIAGVVSTDPAYLMNNDLDGISVALIGRVPCKVVGQVRKGDMLISSDEPGHAQAYKDIHNPPTGSVIGKAIESKDTDGTGVIEVLVGRL